MTERRGLGSDLAAGQGSSDDPLALPAEDVAQLAGIEPAAEQDAVVDSDEIETLGEITDTAIYQGDLEARPLGSDQPDEPRSENLELLTEDELRADETDDPNEAAEEGLTWVPPSDPPLRTGDDGQPVIAAGFGMTADEEPFDLDHHDESLSAIDERTDRVLEALRASAATAGLVDRLDVQTVGSRVVVNGVVDDLVDEDEILAVVAGVTGVSSVESHLELAE
jgi:hypothetical protein